MNPKSGGGKVERFHLVDEARQRDLEQLARQAVANGADVIGMAGGDGSQALVSSIASEFDLPYVCVPAGTRNHLALVRSGTSIEAGVDGEALQFDSPLRFEIVPGALRVRVAPHHPGYSPAAIAESVRRGGIRRLIAVAVGRDPGGPRLRDEE